MRCLLPVTCQEGSSGVEKTPMQTMSLLLISADVCFLCINTLWWKIGTEKSLCLHISQWLTAGENFSFFIHFPAGTAATPREHFSYHDLRSARRSAPKAEQTSEHGFAISLASRQTIFPHAFIVNISLWKRASFSVSFAHYLGKQWKLLRFHFGATSSHNTMKTIISVACELSLLLIWIFRRH